MKNINKELVKQWVKALRSGKYKQGRKTLRAKNDEYCCLGVLCDIAKGTLHLDWKSEFSDDDPYYIDDYAGILPPLVLDYLGVSNGGEYNDVAILTDNTKLPANAASRSDGYVYLIDLNDTYNLSFEQIADIIEEAFLK